MFRFRFILFIVGIFVLASISENTVSATICDANSMEPDFFVHGLCFSPYIDGQIPGDYISIEQIQDRLKIITQKQHMNWIRTFGATNGLENIPAQAKSLGLKIAMGTWIRDNKIQEINNLVAKAMEGLVDIAVVGNEELAAGASTVQMLISDLNDVRQLLHDANCSNIPVTTAEPFSTLFSIDGNGSCTVKYPQLINAVDVVLVNIYPFWKGVHIDISVADLAMRYQYAVEAVHTIDPNKSVIISETGWPSDGLTHIDAEPSLINTANYFFESTKWSTDNNVPMFYFAAFDENWKGPIEVEKHWGIWDSSGQLKQTFVTEPVFCENFDTTANPFCTRKISKSGAPDPNVLAGDPNLEGHFLRLLHDGTGETHLSSVAFDRAAVGAFPRIVAEFDFRLYGPDLSLDADGFAFMHIPTAIHSTTGCSKYSDLGFFAEKPRLSKTFAVGFDVYHPTDPYDKICVSWDRNLFPDDRQIDVPFEIDNGVFNHVNIDLRQDGNDSLVTITLTPDIYNPNHDDPYTIVHNLRIYNLQPYENRVEFVGRNGGLDISADIDNIYVSYKSQICDYVLAGDINKDCKVNFHDLAIVANDWLKDGETNQEACFPSSHPDYANWVTVGQPDCWCCPAQCYGDTNCDGVVDDRDLSPLDPLIGVSYPHFLYDPCFDFDHNLNIDTSDLDIIIAWYNLIPPSDCLEIP
jgi:exo-beta-1,3-glucanase (GH17 family)